MHVGSFYDGGGGDDDMGAGGDGDGDDEIAVRFKSVISFKSREHHWSW